MVNALETGDAGMPREWEDLHRAEGPIPRLRLGILAEESRAKRGISGAPRGRTRLPRVMPRTDLRVPRGISHKAWARLTHFQQDVYRAAARIPRGQTRSYQWVARTIGRPKATRAVGNALHVNPLAPLIPCHRVIRSDGSLGGFARGVKKKQQLLAAEKRRDPC